MSQEIKEKFDSISHFLETGGFEYCVFDMGRKLHPLTHEVFKNIEIQQQAYPFPFQKKAWIALLFWEPDKQQEAVIWFLQFPIDELGFLKLEARDAFLIDLLEQTGKNIQAKQAGKQAFDELQESPFAFKPNPDRLAIFHAFATKLLDQNPSHYYQGTRDYLSAESGLENWQFLGLQGIADVVARLEQDDNEALLVQAIGAMPEQPLVSFCGALENVNPQRALTQALVVKLDNALKEASNNQLLAMLIRALSGALPEKIRQEAFQRVLISNMGMDVEILAAISGRAWNDLFNKSLLAIFMLNLAEQSQMAFNALLADLMMMPKMRELIFEVTSEVKNSSVLGLKLETFKEFVK